MRTPGYVEQDRMRDFLAGMKDTQREQTRESLESAAVIIGAGIAYNAYMKYKRSKGRP